MSDGIIDLSDAPQQSGFGEDTGVKGENAGDFAGSFGKAATGLPGVSAAFNIDKAVTDASPRLARLFDGEATMDDLLAIMQDLSLLGAAMMEVVDGVTANMKGPDPAYIVGALTKFGLDFMLEFFQPLQDAVGAVLGNPDRIMVTSMMWTTASTSLVDLGEYMGATVIEDLAPEWHGAARDAAVQRLGETQGAVVVAATLSSMIAELMALTSQFADLLNNRAKTFLADTVADIVAFAMFLLSPDPITKVEAIITAVVKIAKITLEVVNMALQAARVYLQAVELLNALNAAFDKTVALLDRMAEGC